MTIILVFDDNDDDKPIQELSYFDDNNNDNGILR